MLNTYKAYGWKLREKEGGHIKADKQVLKAPCSKFCFDHNDNLHPPILRMQLIINLLNVKQTSGKFPAHESGAGGSVAYFLAKADFFLTNADLQEGALGHALLCIQCLISRDLGAKQ